MKILEKYRSYVIIDQKRSHGTKHEDKVGLPTWIDVTCIGVLVYMSHTDLLRSCYSYDD